MKTTTFMITTDFHMKTAGFYNENHGFSWKPQMQQNEL